ncbi:hypothetical protein HDE_00864 [Halotydeus destructor]|nr:hypothetical protein HDE_00864 [Halotydeus destructor]
MIHLFSVKVETRLSDLDLVCYVQHEVFQKSLVAISPVVVEPQTAGHQALQLFIFSFQSAFDFGSRRDSRLHVLSQLREVVPVLISERQISLLEVQRDMCLAKYQIPGNSNLSSERNISLMKYWLNVFEFTRRRLKLQFNLWKMIAPTIEYMVCVIFDYKESLRKLIFEDLWSAAKTSLSMEKCLNIPVDAETQAYIEIHRHIMEQKNEDQTKKFYQHAAKLLFAPENEYIMPILMCSYSSNSERSPAGVGKTTFLDIMHEAVKTQSNRIEAIDITDRKTLTGMISSAPRLTFVDDMTMELLFGRPTVQDLIKKFLEGSEPFRGMRTVMTANVNLLASNVDGAEEHNEKVLAAISSRRQSASCHILAIHRRFTIYNFKKILPSMKEQRIIDEMRFMPSRRLRFAGFLKRLYLDTAPESVLTPKWNYDPELAPRQLPAKRKLAITSSPNPCASLEFVQSTACAMQLTKMGQDIQSIANKLNVIYTELCELRNSVHRTHGSGTDDSKSRQSQQRLKLPRLVTEVRPNHARCETSLNMHEEFDSEKIDIDSFLVSLAQPKS